MSTVTKLPETIEEVCQYHGLTLEEVTPYAKPKNDRQHAVNCVEHTFLAVSAINGNWVPDYDSSEEKHEIWADMRGQTAGGSGFSVDGVNYGYSVSDVGARLVFKSRDKAKHFFKYFKHLLEGFMVVKNNNQTL